MNRIDHSRCGRPQWNARSRFGFLRMIAVIAIGLAAAACEYPQIPGYLCDQTNNCADVPTTECNPQFNLCVCASTELIYCPALRECVPDAECLPEAGAPCHDGGGSGGAGGAGGAGGGAGGAGGG